MANRSSTKSKTTLKGTNAADTLMVKHQQITVTAGKGNDKINVNSGSTHKIYGEAGNDTITIGAKASSGSKIYGDDASNKLTGKDTFTINGGKKNTFYGGKGADTFNINGGTSNYLYGSDGNDSLYGGNGSDWLYGGAGANSLYADSDFGKDNDCDTFYFDSQSTGMNWVYGFTPGAGVSSDIIDFGSGASLSDHYNENSNAILELSTGGKICIYGAAHHIIQAGGQSIDFSDPD